ncbi:MAG: type II toxin-antitoxin system HicB family antitoxin [Clostridia bacterium]|nr:type II toxin-antitoxin system HicB family antitoxin [Clostridia bacterium]
MKKVYPVVLTKEDFGYLVYVPDFNINTDGENLYEAIEMARDAISITGLCIEYDGSVLPDPSSIDDINKNKSENDIVTLIDVDFEDYRKKNEMRSIRRNVTLPEYLDYAARKSGINVSAVLQAALKRELKIS